METRSGCALLRIWPHVAPGERLSEFVVGDRLAADRIEDRRSGDLLVDFEQGG